MWEKLAHAVEKRAAIRETDTDALRIVDGPGDGFEDLAIDDWAGNWLVQTRGGEFPEWLRKAEEARAIYWKRLGEKGAPVWIAGARVETPFPVRENGMVFEIDFSSGYSQGLFLDQRDNRRALREMAAGKSVLNCFAYTCAFGVAAAMGGGTTTNIDLSKNYLAWGRRNYLLNNMPPGAHEFLTGEVGNWLARFERKGRHFDIVVLDPPTFSRDDRGRVFTIEAGLGNLVRAAANILHPGGAIFCSTNQRSLSPPAFRDLIRSGLDQPRNWRLRGGTMPPDFCDAPYLKSCWLRSG